ncbi:PQQ-dependent sugar dehydrogenase [Bdellovibrio sp. HCB-162]|uniref:PQQ-dependent sugar dehydrogenase n=1 Tax=Bdellovibrio sp. HCB-162 TaxID=3394234 RepID=UPI0039BD5B5A
MKAKWHVSKWITLFSLLAGFSAYAEVFEKSGYRLDATVLCDGLPQVQVGTPEGICVGILAGKQDGLKMPRYAVQSKEGVIYVSEMGGWAYAKGTIYAVYRGKDSQGVEKTAIVNLFPTKKLTMPNGLVMDPEGRLYVGTPTGVVRFAPRDAKTGQFNIDATPEVVVNDFAKSIFRKDEYVSASEYNSMATKYKNKHPLLQMAVNSTFTEMYINVGAPSDDCGSGIKTIDESGKCIQSESPLASAAVWKINLSNDSQRKAIKVAPFARGLRNSMALAVHPVSGVVIQGENGIDLPSEDLPYEELNILEEGRHYGWPYCHSRGEVAPNFQGKVAPEMCAKQFALPKVFMPAHTAPLGLLYYRSELLPSLKGKLLVAWHGYQKYGQRIVAYPVDERGVPTDTQYQEIVFGWKAQEGVRPRGAPTGLAALNDGSILVIDDKNGAILRISQGKKAEVRPEDLVVGGFSEKTLKAFEPLVPFVKKNCAMCHTQFQKDTGKEILGDMRGTMLNLSSPSESSFWVKLKTRQMPPEMMRSSLGFHDQEYEQVLPQVEAFIKSLNP